MVIRELLQKGTSILKEAKNSTAHLDASVLLCHALNQNKAYLIINSEKEVSEDIKKTYLDFIDKRKNDIPVSYITNQKEFMSLEFYVDRNVLIPRPDTEILVEHIIDLGIKEAKILDLCSGSGCIGISLAHYIKGAQVSMADISDIALEISKKNAENILSSLENVRFYKKDVLNDDFSSFKEYDILVSNPPYIDKKTIKTLGKNVLDFEPHLALDGGEDGLVFYRKISEIAPKILKSGGVLAFEIGDTQAKDVYNIMEENGFSNIKTIKDLAGKDRVLEGSVIK